MGITEYKKYKRDIPTEVIMKQHKAPCKAYHYRNSSIHSPSKNIFDEIGYSFKEKSCQPKTPTHNKFVFRFDSPKKETRNSNVFYGMSIKTQNNLEISNFTTRYYSKMDEEKIEIFQMEQKSPLYTYKSQNIRYSRALNQSHTYSKAYNDLTFQDTEDDLIEKIKDAINENYSYLKIYIVENFIKQWTFGIISKGNSIAKYIKKFQVFDLKTLANAIIHMSDSKLPRRMSIDIFSRYFLTFCTLNCKYMDDYIVQNSKWAKDWHFKLIEMSSFEVKALKSIDYNLYVDEYKLSNLIRFALENTCKS